MVGSRVQQTCKALRGANRRSREERQGRNESGRWQPRAEGRGFSLARSRRREWTRKAHVDGGAIFGQPQERSPTGLQPRLTDHRKVARRPASPARKDSSEPSSPKERTSPRITPTTQLAAPACQAGMEPPGPVVRHGIHGGHAGRANHPHTSLAATTSPRHLEDGRAEVGGSEVDQLHGRQPDPRGEDERPDARDSAGDPPALNSAHTPVDRAQRAL
jgi:hypothetical protein